MRLVVHFIFVAAAKIQVQHKEKEEQMRDKEWENSEDTAITFSVVLHLPLEWISDGKKEVLKH